MKTVFQHIEHVKGQPHHVRKNVAFGAATVGAAFIAVLWFGISISSGSYAIGGANFAESTGAAPTGAQVAHVEASSQVAGAAAALDSGAAAQAPAHIQIVDAPAATTTNTSNQTVIPF